VLLPLAGLEYPVTNAISATGDSWQFDLVLHETVVSRRLIHHCNPGLNRVDQAP